MTDTPTDEGKNNPNPTDAANNAADDQSQEIDNDPMLEGLKEAEAEIAAAEQGKSAQDGQQQDPENPAQGQDDPAKAAPEGKDDGGKGKTPMVPKPRFDEVLSERDLLRDQVGYMKGLLDARQPTPGQPDPAKSGQQDDQKPGPENQGGSKVDEIDAAIEAAEKKKLELAEKYDEGEISTRDWKAQELEIDKEIRGLSNKRLDKVREESRSDTEAALNAQKREEWTNHQAIEIAKNHPNIAVIDAIQEQHVKDGIWKQIHAQAAQNLAQRGIDARLMKQDPRVHQAMMQEKARLTNDSRYTADALRSFLPQDFKAPASPQQPGNGQTDPAKKTPSQTAIERGKKIDLANSQPPSIADMGNGADNGELTDADIEKMSQDQIADLLAKAPHLVKRIMGNSAI